jgi:hypothetical protein
VEGGNLNVWSLSFLWLVFFVLVMTVAFAVRSAAGFGAVLIALPMLAFVLPVSTAVSVITALTAITSRPSQAPPRLPNPPPRLLQIGFFSTASTVSGPLLLRKDNLRIGEQSPYHSGLARF